MIQIQNNFKTNKIAIILFVLIVICTCIGLSYAYWRLTIVQSNNNLVTSDCFSLEFTDENDINLQNTYPMYDEELMNFLLEATPYHFTVTNKCNREMYYSINIESLLLENAVKKLPDTYVGTVIWDGNYSLYDAIQNSSVVESLLMIASLAELPVNSEKVLEETEKAYILSLDNIDANESKSYNLLLFMNYDTPATEETTNATWEGKVTITAEYNIIPEFNINRMLQPRCESGGVGTQYVTCGQSDFNLSFYQDQYISKIKKIVIQNKIEPKENAIETFDESFLKNGEIMSYVVENADGTYTVYIQAAGIMHLPPDSSGYFANMPLLQTIEGLQYLDTSRVKNMSTMFRLDRSLQNLDLSNFNTFSVTDMSSMFSEIGLQTLDLSSFNTMQTKYFFYMFYNSYNLTTIKYGPYFMKKGDVNTEGMFKECPANKPSDTSWSNENLY